MVVVLVCGIVAAIGMQSKTKNAETITTTTEKNIEMTNTTEKVQKETVEKTTEDEIVEKNTDKETIAKSEEKFSNESKAETKKDIYNKTETEKITTLNPTKSNTTVCLHTFKDATCTSPKTCSKCGVTEGKEKGHLWGNWVTEIAAIVGNDGIEKRVCSSCGESERRPIPALSETQDNSNKIWFTNEYNSAKKEYINNLNYSINLKQSEIDNLREEASALYVSYQKEIQKIKESCANSGLSGSGVEQQKLKQAEQNYKNSAQTYTNKINKLENEIAESKNEIKNPSVDNIIVIVANNCNISYSQAYEYYYKYF